MRTLRLELEIRDSLIRLSRLIVALRDEMSLLPVRPAAHLSTIRQRPHMNLHPETYDAVSQHHKFHTSNARSYDWPSQNKGTYTRPGSCFEGHERPARVCMWTSSLISALGVLT
jgi:hypothetical protein